MSANISLLFGITIRRRGLSLQPPSIPFLLCIFAKQQNIVNLLLGVGG